MRQSAYQVFDAQLAEIREAGLWKEERVISSPQGAYIEVGGRQVLNLCANNYLGLSSNPEVIAAAKDALDRRGFGMSSVRFICGTQDIHVELEAEIARFFGFEDAVALRLLLRRQRRPLRDTAHRERRRHQRRAQPRFDHRRHPSLQGPPSPLCERRHGRNSRPDCRKPPMPVCAWWPLTGCSAWRAVSPPSTASARSPTRYDALVMVDDSHASGFVGPTGRGTPEHFGVQGRIDILTSTLGKALGGASGGFTASRRSVTDLLRQRSRPYLFSNSLAPPIVGAGLAALRLLSASDELRERLWANAAQFRAGMIAAGFDVRPGEHPIVPVMVGDARLAAEVSGDMLSEGVYVVGFSYPVVPKGEARIRVQLSAVHRPDDIERAIEAFVRVGRRRGLVGGREAVEE